VLSEIPLPPLIKRENTPSFCKGRQGWIYSHFAFHISFVFVRKCGMNLINQFWQYHKKGKENGTNV